MVIFRYFWLLFDHFWLFSVVSAVFPASSPLPPPHAVSPIYFPCFPGFYNLLDRANINTIWVHKQRRNYLRCTGTNKKSIIFDCNFKEGRTTSSSSSSPLYYCLRENISFDTLIRRSSRGHNSRKATQPSHCGTCLILLIFIAKRVQPSLPSSTLRSNFVYPRQISRSPRVGHCMS